MRCQARSRVGRVATALPCSPSMRSLQCPARPALRAPANGDCIDSMSCGEGRPVTSRMRSSWFMVEVPGKMGLPLISSPRMQPAGGERRMAAAQGCCRVSALRRQGYMREDATAGADNTGYNRWLRLAQAPCSTLAKASGSAAAAPAASSCPAPSRGAHRRPTCPRRRCSGARTAGSRGRGTSAWPRSRSAPGCPPPWPAAPRCAPAQSPPSSPGTRCSAARWRAAGAGPAGGSGSVALAWRWRHGSSRRTLQSSSTQAAAVLAAAAAAAAAVASSGGSRHHQHPGLAAAQPCRTLMSRCSSCAECMYLRERKIWYMMYCLCTSSRMLARITACRSVSMYSNTR